VCCGYVVLCWVKPVVSVRDTNDNCADCKKFFTDLKEMLTDKSEQVRFYALYKSTSVYVHDVCSLSVDKVLVWFAFCTC